MTEISTLQVPKSPTKRLPPNLAQWKVDVSLMNEIVLRIVKVISPQKIILFGSQARGDARPESDLDILVIADTKRPRYRRAAPLYGALSDIIMPMDIMVYSPDEVEEWSGVRQAFITTAIREGKVLYEEQS
ncbi:MAG: nucleotidyltransferase domain-containing protein [Chloroflexi bacterium]|nr:nucleotidyltransferase domain-containing protein [Chloroflexota bacterium]